MFSVSENITINVLPTIDSATPAHNTANLGTRGSSFVVIFSKTESLISSYAKVATCV